jgi:hypothetical protein
MDLADWEMSDPIEWRIQVSASTFCLSIKLASDTKPLTHGQKLLGL